MAPNLPKMNHLPPGVRIVSISLVFGCGLAMSCYSAIHAIHANGSPGFPLDDPWIHLQFARNLHDFGSYSYFKNEMVTSGSTSPLFTILLATGFFFTSNEFVLCYVLGVAFFVLAAFFLFQFALLEYEGSVLMALSAPFLMLFEPRLEWIALSGMETTLFLCLLMAALWFHRGQRPVLFGVACGLLLWTRPEGIIFVGVVLLDALYDTWWVRRSVSRSASAARKPLAWRTESMGVFALFALAYCMFNLVLSGTVLPNTYAAKVKYYGGGASDFPAQAFYFFSDGHMRVLSVFSLIGILSVISAIIRRQPTRQVLLLLWVMALFLAYWRDLPYLYQEGRYLMPALPIMILLGISGLRQAVQYGKKVLSILEQPRAAMVVQIVALAVLGTQFVIASVKSTATYAEYCKYINDRQVRTAKWLHDNLPEQAVIGTHDVGAIGFYSGRRIADMVGLISPEMIDNIGNLEKLKQFLAGKKTTHLAVLRNWFDVPNQNPIFRTDERFPEIMEVFEVDPSRVHFTPGQVSRMDAAAASFLSAGDVQRAGPILEQSLRMDPQSSRTRFLLAAALASIGRLGDAEQQVRSAMRLHPSYWDAQLLLAQITAKQNKPDEAIALLEHMLGENPSYAPGFRLLADIYASFRIDSVKSKYYLNRYHVLVQE